MVPIRETACPCPAGHTRRRPSPHDRLWRDLDTRFRVDERHGRRRQLGGDQVADPLGNDDVGSRDEVVRLNDGVTCRLAAKVGDAQARRELAPLHVRVRDAPGARTGRDALFICAVPVQIDVAGGLRGGTTAIGVKRH